MIGTRLSDRFEITGELGRGGMGVVYRARDPVLDRDVAVKMVSLGSSPELQEERFRREAQVVAGLDHPAIVPIFDFGRHQDSLYFVMPVVRGTTLHDFIDQDSLNLGETLEIIAQIADALGYSAGRGVVHRDVKPENIMVSRDGASLRARIMDFGLALPAAGNRITKTGQLPGTLAYLSPEYIMSLDIDGRSDIYSLGTILYECLAGEPPFTGPQGAVLFRIVHEEPPTLGVDPRLAAIVMRCLAKEPKDRPARGSELAVELRSFRQELSDNARRQTPMSQELRRLQARRAAAPPLIGRAAELAEITRRLDLALAGKCQLVLLGGEAGIGKTRLLLELELRVRARGVRVVRGRFSGQEGTFPHHGFCELIQDYYRAKAEAGSSPPPDMGDLAVELLKRFPVLNEIGDLREAATSHRAVFAGVAAQSEQSLISDQTLISGQSVVFELLARALIRLAAGEPAVLLLENLHLADASIAALEYLVHRLGPTPTLVVGTCRMNEISKRHGVARLIRDFSDDPRFTSVHLEALTADEHRDLVLTLLESSRGIGLRLDDDLAERLYEATEGNPFFTRELVRALLDSGDVDRDTAGSWVLSGEAAIGSAMPATIQQAVEARLENLPEEVLATLRIASVLGRSFAVDDLKGLAGGGEPVDETVDQLIREGILEEDRRSRGDVVSFSSGVVREVLHGVLTRRRRRSLHRRYAAQLEERHAGHLERVYPQLVYHFSEGDVAVKTVAYALMLARMAAGAVSPTDTIRATRTALEFVEDEDLDDSGEVEGELRLLLASALRTVGNVAGALKEAARAVRSYRQSDQGPAAAACLVAAETAWQIRRIDDTRHWLEKGIKLARAAGAGRKLQGLLTLAATVANLRGEHQLARGYLEEVGSLAAEAPRLGAETPPAGGILITALSNPATTADPVACRSVEDAEILANVFDSLLASDSQGNLTPRLCDDWHASSDSTTFTLTLRPDVLFSDGSPLTAREAKLSFERSARRGAGHPVSAFTCLSGLAAYLEDRTDEITGIEVAGDRRIRFQLVEPLPIFPALLTDLRTAMAREVPGGLLGTGPFRVAERDPRRVVLERNPRDWRGSPSRLDRVELRVCTDEREIASGLFSGELDLGRDLSPEDLEKVLRDRRFRGGLVEAPKKNVYFVLFNLAGPVARNPEVRRALAHSIRAQDVVWRTLGRFAQPATCLIPPGILGHDPGRLRPYLRRDEAAEVLASIAEGTPLRLRAAAHPLFSGRYRSLLAALLDDWRALGAEVEVETSSMESYLAAWRDCSRFDLLLARWVPDYDDPDNLTFVPFHSRDGFLHGYLGGCQLDDLLEQARHEQDRIRRRVLYRKVESRFVEDSVVLPLFHDVDYRIASPGVRGLRPLSSPPYINYSELGKEPAEAPVVPVAETARPGAIASELRVPLPAAFDGLDPALALFVEPAEIVPNVFETLTRVGEGARIAPCLASRYRLEDGSRRLRIELRDGVRFHDGRKLTTRDVRYSFERLLRSRYAGVESALMPIRGARDFAAQRCGVLSGLRILSSTELAIELEEPLAFFPAMLANPMTVIVPEGTVNFSGSWQQGCAGTGPFRVVGIVPRERIELEANPHYWRPGSPRCRRLTFELGVESRHVGAAFRAGELSIASCLRPEDVEALRREPEYMRRVRQSPGFSTYFLALSSLSGPLADLEIRRALVRAIDVEAVVKTTLGPLGLPADGLISPGLPGHEARSRRRRPDPATSAGHSRPEIVTSLHPAYRGQYADVWRHLRRPIAASGVNMNVLDLPMPEMLERIKRGEVDLVAARRIAAYPDSDALVNIFHSRDGLFGKLVGNRQIDRLIEKGRSEVNPALRHVAYRELELILEREALLIPLFDEQICCVARPEVRGLRIRLGWPKVAYEELSLEH